MNEQRLVSGLTSPPAGLGAAHGHRWPSARYVTRSLAPVRRGLALAAVNSAIEQAAQLAAPTDQTSGPAAFIGVHTGNQGRRAECTNLQPLASSRTGWIGCGQRAEVRLNWGHRRKGIHRCVHADYTELDRPAEVTGMKPGARNVLQATLM
jgi:hypothetical protein